MSLLGKRGRELKLLMSCPSLSNSKIIQFITYDDKKIDLGSIARTFGLDPSTLRLNGYFISRGVDLISSSVTWNSLLSFFSSKGLSTGKDYHDALLVTAKVRNNRGHESQDFQNGICKVIESEHAGSSRGNELEDINLLKNKKLRESKSGEILNGLNCKRKQQFEDVNQFKKLKINEDKSGISHSQFTCSITSKNLKRFREDDTIVAANYKRIR